jgi:hypothetical protein
VYRVETGGEGGGERSAGVRDRLLGAWIPRSWVGENPPSGAVIHTYFAEKPKDSVSFEILDSSGALVREEKVAAEAGMNRFEWNLRYPGPELLEGAILWGGSRSGPKAVPGSYRVRVRSGEWSEEKAFRVLRDPELAVSEADLKEQFDFLVEVRDALTGTHAAIRRLRDVKSQAQAISDRMKSEEVTQAAKSLEEKLTAVEDELIQRKSSSRQDPLNFPGKLDNQLFYLYGVAGEQDDKPTAGARARFTDLKKEVDRELQRLGEILDREVAAFNDLMKQKAAPAIFVTST